MTTTATPPGTQQDGIFLCPADESGLRPPPSPSSSSPGGSSGVDASENAGAAFELDAWIRDEPMECLMDLPEVQLDAPCTGSGPGAGDTMQAGSDAMFLSQALDMGDVFDDRHTQQQDGGQQGLPSLVDAKSSSLLPDLRKIIVKKPIMDKAVERLGGGRKGAMRLWSIIQVWLRQQQQQQGQGHQTSALPFHGNEMLQQLGQASSILDSDEQSSLLYASAFGGRQQHQMLASQQHEQYACYTGDAHHFYNVPAAYAATTATATATATGDGCPRSPAATTRAARKSRMARQRRHTARASAGSSSWHPSSPQAPQAAAGTREATSSLYNCHDGKDKSVKFLLQKELKPSDVGNLGRIVLPKKEAELHLPYLSLREGITIAMEDMITNHLWHFRYRFWPNNKSRMYLLESTGDYVKTHYLKEGDVLQLYKDTRTGTHMICCKKVIKTNQAAAVAKLEEDNVSGVSSISDCQEQVRALESTVEEDSRPRPSTAAAGDGLEQFPSLDVGDEFIEEIMSLVEDSADEDSS